MPFFISAATTNVGVFSGAASGVRVYRDRTDRNRELSGDRLEGDLDDVFIIGDFVEHLFGRSVVEEQRATGCL